MRASVFYDAASGFVHPGVKGSISDHWVMYADVICLSRWLRYDD